MIKLVKLKNSDKFFYAKFIRSFEFGIPSGNWINIEDNENYLSENLIFLQDI